MGSLDQDVIRCIITSLKFPLVLRNYVSNWPIYNWKITDWSSKFGERKIPFRCLNKQLSLSDEPCWERKCDVKQLSFSEFLSQLDTSEDWMYFDYKYLHQWFPDDSDIFKQIHWKQFGFPEKGAVDSTLWVGSDGSHTPMHQDTYGTNIVVQLMGKKRWLLFPPETPNLKPTRVPYEESSIYSELNFYCPINYNVFAGLSGCHTVDLSAGDALIVPQGWWHYVQNIDRLNIAVNVWLPHEKDASTRVSEAVIRILVAQVCKDLPQGTRKMLLNPNEDDIADIPLAVLFLELETVAQTYLTDRQKNRRAKRQKLEDDANTNENLPENTLNSLLANEKNQLELTKPVDGKYIVNLLKENLQKYAKIEAPPEPDEVDNTTNLRLTKALIDAFSDSSVIEQIKQNLLHRLS